MAGTLTISTLSDGTNSTSATNPIKGSAKAWAVVTGSTGAILGSYNVSSVTHAAGGNFVFNYTNALPSTNYAVSYGIEVTSVPTNLNNQAVGYAGGRLTTSFQLITGYNAGGASVGQGDPNVVYFTAFSN